MTADGQGGSAMPEVQQPPSIDELKRHLRRQARERRAAAHGRSAAPAALALRDRLVAGGGLPSGDALVVAGYAPIGEEIDVTPALRALLERGCSCVLPVVVAGEQVLEFRAWRPDMPMQPGPYGILEPPATAPVGSPDLLLVPMLAFDRLGGRLGYGGGFYDRTLTVLRRRRRVLAVGVAFAEQEVAEVPLHAADERLDRIVTECETIVVDEVGAG